MAHEFNVFYYLGLLKKRWKIIFIVVAVSVILAVFSALLKPVTYISSTTILLVGESGLMGGPSGGFFGILGLSIGNTSKDVIIAILQSNRMATDITEQFKSYAKPFWWKMDIDPVATGFVITIKGPDPELTEKIADFCVDNIDKINAELNITLNKPMVKVLDPAGYGVPERRRVSRKVFIAVIFSFLCCGLYIFLLDYLKKLKGSR